MQGVTFEITKSVDSLRNATAAAKQLLKTYAITDFAPSAHTHELSDVDELVDALASKYDSSHVGTTANKLVQLTAAAKLPAVDGSLLTNLPSGDVSGVPQPLRNMTASVVADPSTTPVAVDYIGSYLYGSNTSGGLYRSTDMGLNWTLVQNAPMHAQRILLCSDGEVIISNGGSVYKSTGWASNPATATFAIKFNTNGTAGILYSSIDGNGTKFIVSEYAAGGNFADSRYVTISLDSGNTWTRKYDSGNTALTHLHCCCYDPYEDRFWFTEGHSATSPDQGGIGGMYFSDDDGDTWTHNVSAKTHYNGAYIVMLPTEHGLVCATDQPKNGLWIFPRTADPENTDPYQCWNWMPSTAFDGQNGFGTRGVIDPDTGIAYVGFTLGTTGLDAIVIAASDGRYGSLVHRFSEGTTAGDRVENIVAKDGILVGSYAVTGATVVKKFRAETSPYLLPFIDENDLLKAQNVPNTSIGVGAKANVNNAGQSVLIGQYCSLATASIESVVIGYDNNLTGNGSTVLIGSGVDSAATSSVLIGTNITASGAFQVVVGNNASVGASGAMAFGAGVVATGAGNVAAGINITASTGGSSTSFGATITALASCTAIGQAVTASGVEAVLVGNSTTANQKSVSVGNLCDVGQFSVGIGYDVTSGGGGPGGYVCTAIGYLAIANAVGATAIGASATCLHDNSTALGYNLTTTAANQVHLGPRHIEITEMTAPSAGATNSARIFARDNGSGKTQVCVIFPTGAIQVLATEP